ncbi:MAG: segregation/condensation protein A [Eggerthellaceae bacterium]|nr:segregation/condensation protein A [Eggerthellaceae bacterium]
MAYRVNVENFEGPFDLLLELVSRDKVDIGSISITEIIDQYLAEIQNAKDLDLDVASDFFYVAATLLNIKAESLLDMKHEPLEDELQYLSPAEAREMLIAQLVEYKTFKNAAADLERRAQEERRRHVRPFGPDREFLDTAPDFLRGITVDDLGRLAAAALARREAFILDAQHIASKPIPVEVYVKTIYERIRNRAKMRFSELVDEHTPSGVVVVSFLAVLELYKRGMIKVRQKREFGDIEMSYIQGAPPLVLKDAEVTDVQVKGKAKDNVRRA